MLIIGDVHGQLALLKVLLNNVHEEEVYFVGDLIDRGPESIATLKLIMESSYKAVMGNHEKLMLDTIISKDIEIRRQWFNNSARRTYKEYKYKTSRGDQVSILSYLKSLPYYIYIDNEDILISHAGVKGSRGYTGYSVSDCGDVIKRDYKEELKKILDMQKVDDFIWSRDFFIDNKELTDFHTIFIAGHNPTPTISLSNSEPKIIRYYNRFFIDCGAFYTKVLGGLQIRDNKVTAHYNSEEKGYYFEDLGKLRQT